MSVAVVDSSSGLDRCDRTPVAPRGFVLRSAAFSTARSGAETLPLELLVRRELFSSARPSALAICAGPGFGKSTALRHLATVLRDVPDVTLLDEPDLSYVNSIADQT